MGHLLVLEYLWDAMFCKEFPSGTEMILEGIALRCRDSSDDVHLGVVVLWQLGIQIHVKVEVVSTEELPWASQGQCWLELLLWVPVGSDVGMLGIVQWDMFDVWVDSRPIHTVSCTVLAFADSHISFMFCLEDLLPFWWRNDEQLHLEGWGHHQLLWMFLWPWYGHRACRTSLISSCQPADDCLQQESRGAGSSWMRVWNSVFLLDVMCTWLIVMSRGISGALQGCIVREGICSQHLFARSILDGYTIALESKQHSL